MPVPEELLAAARKFNASATLSLLESYYPLTHRIAYALCGDPAVADRIIKQVMRRALSVLPRWRDETLPDRWFYHHTVLACRSVGKQQQNVPQGIDALIPSVAGAAYVAFIRTLRLLPTQQREAVVLSQGERLNARFLGIAMDCSGNAAGAHLQAATDTLREMIGDRLNPLYVEFTHVYKALAPSAPALASLRGNVALFTWPRLVWRRIVLFTVIALIVAAAWGAWHFRYLLPNF